METGNEELHSAKEKRFVDEGQKIFKWIPAAAIVAFLLIVVIQVKSCKEERAKDPPPPPVNKSAAPGYEGIVPPETRIIDLVPGEEGVVSSRGYRRVSFDPKGGCIIITRPDGHSYTDCPGMSISGPSTDGGEFIIRPVDGPVRVVVVLQK